MNRILTDLGIPWLIPHRLFRQWMGPADTISLLLQHMEALYSSRGIDVKPLKEAAARYHRWLKETRKRFNRRRRLTRGYIDEECRLLFRTGNGGELIRNKKLSRFIQAILFEDAILDYLNLKWE